MRTAGVVQQGTANTDGHVFFAANSGRLTSGTGTLTRAAKGNSFLSIAAGQTAILNVPLADLMFRFGMNDDLQQQYGSTANGGSNIQNPNFVGTGPLLQRPPFTGTTEFNVPTTFRPTGIGFKNIYPIFQVGGVPLTLNTIGLTKTQFANGQAPVVTDILAPTACGTAVTNPNVATPLIPISATPVMQVARWAEYIVEWQVTTPAGSSVNLYGFFLDLFYNYN